MSRVLVVAVLFAGCAEVADDGAALMPEGDELGMPAYGMPADVLPPPGIPLQLDLTEMVAGEQVTIQVGSADPGETVQFLRSSSVAPDAACPAVLGGACLDLDGKVVRIGSAVADASGVAELSFNLPLTAPVGASVAFQAAAIRGPGAVDTVVSNAQVGTIFDLVAWENPSLVIDGVPDEFGPDEMFGTTSGTATWVSYNADDLVIASQHPDVVAGGPEHWMVIYLGTGAPGTTAGLVHNTQEPILPFDADLMVRRKADGSYDSLERWDGMGWVGTSPWLGSQGSAVAVSNPDETVEIAIPRALLGSDVVDVVVAWLYEGNGFETTYAGLPADAFVDGYDADWATYLTLDMASPDGPVTQNP